MKLLDSQTIEKNIYYVFNKLLSFMKEYNTGKITFNDINYKMTLIYTDKTLNGYLGFYENNKQVDEEKILASLLLLCCHSKEIEFTKNEKAFRFDRRNLNEVLGKINSLFMIEPFNIRRIFFNQSMDFSRQVDFLTSIMKQNKNSSNLGNLENKIEFFMKNFNTIAETFDKNFNRSSSSVPNIKYILDKMEIPYEILNDRNFITNPAVGRENEIRDAGAVLATPSRSLILLGEPGVGKTAVIEGLAYAIGNGAVSDVFRDKIIVKINSSSLDCDTRYRGEYEKKLEQIINVFKDNPNFILYIDEIHTLYGSGRTADSSNDALNILKPYLENGSIKLIGATTNEEYDKYLREDPAFIRRCKAVNIEEPEPRLLKDIIVSNIFKFQIQLGLLFLENEEKFDEVIAILLSLTIEKNRDYRDKKRKNPALILSIIEDAYGYALYDGAPYVGIEYLEEAINKCDVIYDSIRLKHIELLENLKKKEITISNTRKRVISIDEFVSK